MNDGAFDLIDISLTLSSSLPRWPGSPPLELHRRLDMARGDACNDSALSCYVHSGTHVDAPLHFLPSGSDVTALPMAALIGPAVVAHLPAIDAITPAELETLPLPAGTTRLLLRTRNSTLWASGRESFEAGFVALTEQAARWIVDRGIRLVGVDYLSVQRYCDGPETHQILLAASVVIVEGLDLSAAEPGTYELLCLPLKLAGAEGAPARAVLRRIRT